MICKHCGQKIVKVKDEWWAVKYQGGEGLIDVTTEMCIIPLGKGQLASYGMLIPHEPSKNSIVSEIIKDL